MINFADRGGFTKDALNHRRLAINSRIGLPSFDFADVRLPALSLFAVVFFFAYKYAAIFNFNSPAPLWFPDSVLLCALLLVPKRQWWLYLLVSLPFRLALERHSGAPTWFVLTAFANDSLKTALSAYALQRFTSGPVRLNTLRQFAVFIGTAVIAMPALSAVVGGAARMAVGYEFLTSCYSWFLGDAIAALAITPTLLYWCLKGWREIDAHAVEVGLLIVGFAASLYFTFLLPHSDYSPIVLYTPVPFLIWAATRVGPIGISTANSLLALVSMTTAVEGKGPFSANYSNHSVLSMQLFLAVISVPMLFVAILIQQRREVENSLRESRETLKQQYERGQLLSQKLINSQEDERRRIARDLHDHIGQSLALLSISLQEANQALPIGMAAEHSLMDDIGVRIADITKDVHGMSHQLHSSTLQHLGLEAALQSLCRETARKNHIIVDFQSNCADHITNEVSLCAFRVAEEALTNAVRHGRADQIRVTLQQEAFLLRIQISDKGNGFDVARSSDGLGLVSMKERLRMLGGQLVVKSQPGNGTDIRAEVPLKETA